MFSIINALFFLFLGCYTDQSALIQTEYRSVKCIDAGYEIQNLCEDEKEYLDWASNYRPDLKFRDLTKSDLAEIVQNTNDVDKAAAFFYQRLITDPQNKEFLDRVKTIETSANPNYNKKFMFAVAPGMFYKDNQANVDATGASLRSIAANLGMQTHVIETEQTGTVEQNGQIICQYIEQVYNEGQIRGLILASASKGSSDIKMAIQQCANQPFFQIVHGWFNIGGILQGSRLVNYILDHTTAYWKARYYFWRNNYNWQGLVSMRWGANAPLSKTIEIPKTMTAINVIGVPLFRHVTQRARPFYLAMVPEGPSDGIVLLAESTIPNAITYGAFRNDHYFQWPIPEQRIRGFLIYMIEKTQ